MKTIYLTLLAAILLSTGSKAQLTLLGIYHEPTVGDKDGKRLYDSTTTVPKNTGSAVTWDFSGLTMRTTAATTESFMASGAVASSSLFAGDSLAGTKNNSTYMFYKKNGSPSAFELMGSYSSNSTVRYSDTKIIYKWPISFNTTYMDTYSGTDSSTVFSNINGTVTVNATGEGNIILPGSASYTNILQVRTTDMMVKGDTAGISSTVMTTTRYEYFYSLQKFPLVTITYMTSQTDTMPATKTASLEVNYLVAVGLNDYNFDASYVIYPNPAKDHFSVKLSNTENSNCLINIYNAVGQEVKAIDLGKSSYIDEKVNVSGLSPGIYIVKTSLGDRSSARRLIVE
jgi:hypothetical protein